MDVAFTVYDHFSDLGAFVKKLTNGGLYLSRSDETKFVNVIRDFDQKHLIVGKLEETIVGKEYQVHCMPQTNSDKLRKFLDSYKPE